MKSVQDRELGAQAAFRVACAVNIAKRLKVKFRRTPSGVEFRLRGVPIRVSVETDRVVQVHANIGGRFVPVIAQCLRVEEPDSMLAAAARQLRREVSDA
ncbi:MAG: hypothetical protein WC789_14485 [Lentisphaeria bacterium]